MRKARKPLCLLLCAVLLLSMSAAALGANNNYSSWFQTNYDEINKLGLMPASFNGLDLTKDITRGEMCELAVYAFEKATGNDIDMSNETFTGFTDTSDENIVKAHLYGIVNGYEDGSFRPKQLLTRQEFFKLIENFCTAAAFSPKAKDGALNGFADAGSISAWAKEAAQICVSYSYVQGTKLGNGTYLNPKDNASRQEAMTMFLRCYKTIQWFYDENVKSATVVVDQINLNVTVTSISKTMYVCRTEAERLFLADRAAEKAALAELAYAAAPGMEYAALLRLRHSGSAAAGFQGLARHWPLRKCIDDQVRKVCLPLRCKRPVRALVPE